MEKCPICNGIVIAVKADPYDGDYRAVCKSCGLRCPTMGRDKEEAIKEFKIWAYQQT